MSSAGPKTVICPECKAELERNEKVLTKEVARHWRVEARTIGQLKNKEALKRAIVLLKAIPNPGDTILQAIGETPKA